MYSVIEWIQLCLVDSLIQPLNNQGVIVFISSPLLCFVHTAYWSSSRQSGFLYTMFIYSD